jgi:DNA modification methylase
VIAVSAARGVTATIVLGHVLDGLRLLPDRSVQCVVTSPPYWGLRDYGTAAWEGGDPACDHVVRAGDPATSTLAAAGSTKTVVAHGQQKYRDVCLRCGARRIEPTVWDGDPACAHEWDGILTPAANGIVASEMRGETLSGRSATRRPRTSAACRKCGAWRGALGLEPTPELYAAHLVAVFREVRRVLRDDGVLWLNMGDCYATGAGSVGAAPGGGWQGDRWKGYRGTREESRIARSGAIGPMTQPNRMPIAGLKPKDLVGMPWRVAFALQADGWWLRMDVVWAKPNPMPESVTDRPTRAHEFVFLFAKGTRVTRIVKFSDLPREVFHFGKHLRTETGDMGAVGICVRLATAIFEGTQAKHEYRLPPFYAEEWKQRPDGSDSDFVRGMPNTHRAAAEAARFLASQTTAKEFMRQLDGRIVALSDGDDLLIRRIAALAGSPDIHGDADGTITVHHSGQVSKIDFTHDLIVIEKPAEGNYFYDQDAIREPVADGTLARLGQSSFWTQTGGDKDYAETGEGLHSARRSLEDLQRRYGGSPSAMKKLLRRRRDGMRKVRSDEPETLGLSAERGDGMGNPQVTHVLGANKRSVWPVPTEAMGIEHCRACDRTYWPGEYALLEVRTVVVAGRKKRVRVCRCGRHDAWGSHFATFPQALILPAILAGTSAKGACPVCGAPWIRITARTAPSSKAVDTDAGRAKSMDGIAISGGGRRAAPEPGQDGAFASDVTVGWRPTCVCGAPTGLGLRPDDMEPIASPVGAWDGDEGREDPSLEVGRAGMARDRRDGEGVRIITRFEQRAYAAQIRASDRQGEMREDARRLAEAAVPEDADGDEPEGPDEAFAHWIRTDRVGARAIPEPLLERWIAAGWLRSVEVPVWTPPWACMSCGFVLVSGHVEQTETSTKLRGVREADHERVGDAVLRQEMRERMDSAAQGVDEGPDRRAEGIHPDPGSRPSDGDAGRLRDGAPSRHGGASEEDASKERSRPPQERESIGQQDREPPADAEASPRQEDGSGPDPSGAVPELRPRIPSQAERPVCPRCGSDRLSQTVPCTVLDPFLGSGTTALVAAKNGRSAVGIELQRGYLPIMRKRLEAMESDLLTPLEVRIVEASPEGD